MNEIIKTRFKCKGYYGILRYDKHKKKEYWDYVFQEGKWYEGEYKTRRSEESFRLNGHKHDTYWAIDEHGEKQKLTPNYFAITFYSPEEEREEKINELLK